jgi:hypothetical protein
MPRGEDTSKHPNRGVSRQAFMMTGADMEYYQNRANAGQDEDGPLCSNCTDDMGEALEWHDRESIHPSKRVPCVGCGAK